MKKTLINNRWPLLLPEHRADRPEWPWWEATRLAAMSHFVRPGHVVFDIGAEEGDFPALFAMWGARVVMVEPNPKVWPNIRAIFESNYLEHNIIGHYVGFASDRCEDSGDTEHAWRDAISTEWPECAYGPVIGDHGFRHLAQETDTTPQITIDALANRFGKPDHITIDIEGSELTALRGATFVLTEYRPFVWVSVHPDPLKDFYCEDPQAVYDLMAEAGYERIFLTFDHESHELFVPKERCWPL